MARPTPPNFPFAVDPALVGPNGDVAPDHPHARFRRRLSERRTIAERQEAELAARADAAGLGGLPIARVPVNDRALVPLPAGVRQAFLDGLRERVAALRVVDTRAEDRPSAAAVSDAAGAVDGADAPADVEDEPVGDGAPTIDVSSWPELDGPTTRLLGNCCAVCRGSCCGSGGEHAYLRGDWLAFRRAEAADLDDAAFVARYEPYLPVEHYRDSCVFHGERGCTLPREYRSPLCNHYQCGELVSLARRLEPALAATPDTVTVLAGAANWSRIHRTGVVGPDGVTPLPDA